MAGAVETALFPAPTAANATTHPEAGRIVCTPGEYRHSAPPPRLAQYFTFLCGLGGFDLRPPGLATGHPSQRLCGPRRQATTTYLRGRAAPRYPLRSQPARTGHDHAGRLGVRRSLGN